MVESSEREGCVATRQREAKTVIIGWVFMPIGVAAYLYTRFVTSAPWGVALAQLLYLAPIAVGAALFFLLTRRSVPRTRPHVMWRLLSLALTASLIGEAAASAEIVGWLDPGISGVVFDVANALAMATLVALIAVTTAADRLGWRRAFRLALDIVSVAALVFALLYRYWTSSYAVGIESAADAIRLSAYGIAGIALFGANAIGFVSRDTQRVRSNALVTLAVASLMGGVAVWTSGELMDPGPQASVAITIVSSAMYISGYYLAALAALYRLYGSRRAARGSFGSGPMPLRIPAAWPGALGSTLVFVSVVALSAFALDTDGGSVSAAVYVGALSVATVSMVVRTMVANSETRILASNSLEDPVTGAVSAAGLPVAYEDTARWARGTGATFALFSVGLDDFARVNAALGYRGGDRVLATVEEALESTAGEGAWVIRRSGDEFVVLAPVSDRAGADRLARRLLIAVASIRAERSVTASVGYAVHGAESNDLPSLVMHAEAAQLWAKRHGKNRVTGHDPRLAAALGLDSRLESPQGGSTVDMARALLAASDARDPADRYHSRNVASLCRLFAESEGLSPEAVGRIELAAILHDVGKIALTSEVAEGHGSRAREDLTRREHAVLGQRLVESLGDPGVPLWVRSHHERWDGAGYPDGLSGLDIPFEARLIALADTYDQLTRGTSRRPPMSKAAALQEIDLGMGASFDPDLAERFIGVIASSEALGWSDERGTL